MNKSRRGSGRRPDGWNRRIEIHAIGDGNGTFHLAPVLFGHYYDTIYRFPGFGFEIDPAFVLAARLPILSFGEHLSVEIVGDVMSCSTRTVLPGEQSGAYTAICVNSSCAIFGCHLATSGATPHERKGYRTLLYGFRTRRRGKRMTFLTLPNRHHFHANITQLPRNRTSLFDKCDQNLIKVLVGFPHQVVNSYRPRRGRGEMVNMGSLPGRRAFHAETCLEKQPYPRSQELENRHLLEARSLRFSGRPRQLDREDFSSGSNGQRSLATGGETVPGCRSRVQGTECSSAPGHDQFLLREIARGGGAMKMQHAGMAAIYARPSALPGAKQVEILDVGRIVDLIEIA